MIVLGRKSRGDEPYDLNNVKYGDWWSKKWGSRLVKTRYALHPMQVGVRILNYLFSD